MNKKKISAQDSTFSRCQFRLSARGTQWLNMCLAEFACCFTNKRHGLNRSQKTVCYHVTWERIKNSNFLVMRLLKVTPGLTEMKVVLWVRGSWQWVGWVYLSDFCLQTLRADVWVRFSGVWKLEAPSQSFWTTGTPHSPGKALERQLAHKAPLSVVTLAYPRCPFLWRIEHLSLVGMPSSWCSGLCTGPGPLGQSLSP